MPCTGCEKYFCWKDFETHRNDMFVELDKIVEERNRLQEALNNEIPRNDETSPLLEQIDQWQRSTIAKVKQVAAQVRQQTVELLNRKQAKISEEFKSFSQELVKLRESENYVEHDLGRLKQKIDQFKQDIKQSTQPATMVLHTDQSDQIHWESLIYVEEKQVVASNPRQATTTSKRMSIMFKLDTLIMNFFE